MMNCSEINRLMTVYMDGELDDILSKEFEEHLAGCPQCREEFGHVKRVVGLCAIMPEEELPQDFSEKLHKKLMEAAKVEKSSKRSEIIKRKYIKICSTIAAGLIMFLVLGGLYERIGGNFPHYSKSDANNAAQNAQTITGNGNMEAAKDTLSSASTENSAKNKNELFTAGTAQDAGTAAEATAENKTATDTTVESVQNDSAYKTFAGKNGDWEADNTAESATINPDTCTQLQERTLDSKRQAEEHKMTASPPPSEQTDEYKNLGIMPDGGSGPAEENKSINILLRSVKTDAAEAYIKTICTSNGGGVISEMQAGPQTAFSIQSNDVQTPANTQPSKEALSSLDINMKIKLPAKNFENFMSALRNAFEPADIETGAVYNTDLELRINELEKERMDMTRKIADLENSAAAGASEELEFLKSESTGLQNEIEKLKKAREAVIVNITIRKK